MKLWFCFLIGLSCFSYLSFNLAEEGRYHEPIIILVSLGFLWLLILKKQAAFELSHPKLLILFFILSRVPLFWSSPLLEDDYYRYLWDGIVSSHLDNALIISPEEILISEEETVPAERLRRIQERRDYLSEDKLAELLHLVNYPESPSVYGPFAQFNLGFVTIVSSWLHRMWEGEEADLKYRIQTLRLYLILVEALCCWVFFLLVNKLNLSHHLSCAFILCPLLIKEVGNSLHIDILALCMSLIAFYCALSQKSFKSGLCLGLAMAVKSYSLVLIPIFLIHLNQKKKFLIILVITLCFLYIPYVWDGGIEIWAGTRYFASCWSMNDFFPALLRECFFHMTDAGSYEMSIDPIGTFWVQLASERARYLSFLCFCIWYIYRWFYYRNQWKREDLFCHACADVLFAVYYFSPVQNPWYLIWGLAFFILAQKWLYLFWIASAQLYLYQFVYKGTAHLFHPFQFWVIVPHVIWLIFFIVSAAISKKQLK